MCLQIARPMPPLRNPIAYLLHEVAEMFRDIVFELLARANHNFRGGGGRGSANIGNKIRNRCV